MKKTTFICAVICHIQINKVVIHFLYVVINLLNTLQKRLG